MTESTKIIAEVEDKASGQLRAVASAYTDAVSAIVRKESEAIKSGELMKRALDSNVKSVKELGGRVKASTEFAGTIANAFGGTAVGQFAGQIGQLTEKVSAFSEVSKTGTAGLFAFKAGLVATGAAIAFQISKQIGTAIYSMSDFAKSIRETKDLAVSSVAQLQAAMSTQINFRRQEIELIRDPERKQAEYKKLFQALNNDITKLSGIIADGERQVAEYDNSLEAMLGFQDSDRDANEAMRAQVNANKQMLESLKQQRDDVRNVTSERASNIEKIKEENALKEKSNSFIDSLRTELELLRTKKENLTNLLATQNAFGEDDQETAKLLLDEINLLKEKTAAEEKAAQAKLANEERIKSLQESELSRLEQQRILLEQGEEAAASFALQRQGLSKEQADAIAKEDAALQKQLDQKRAAQAEEEKERDKRDAKILKSAEKKSAPTAPENISAVESRTLTRGGRRDSWQDKIISQNQEIINKLNSIKDSNSAIESNTERSPGESLEVELV